MSSPGDTLTLETSKGPVVIEMNPAVAPGHVAHIKRLVGGLLRRHRLSWVMRPRASTTASSFIG